MKEREKIMYDNNNIEKEEQGGMNPYTQVNSTFEDLNPEEEIKPKKRAPKKFMQLTASALVFGLVAASSFQGVRYVSDQLINGSGQEATNGSNATNKGTEVATTSEDEADALATTSTSQKTTVNDVSDVVEQVMPSIVSITSTQTVENNYFGQSASNEVEGSGSGIIIGKNTTEVLIATNNHVVSGATKVEVTFSDETVVSATVKGTDSSNDLALVSVKLADLDNKTKSTIKIASVGDSETLKAGEMVIAIGNALGYGQSVTVGYVSALDREVQTDDYTMSLIQTDAAINPGNSGGALLNASGQVIGINSVKYSSEEVEGMGYAIPISDAIPIINDLMNRQTITEEEQAYLGIQGNEVTSEYSERFNIPIGIYVAGVAKDSPAADAGILENDVIVSFNGKAVETMQDLQEKLSGYRAGEKVEVTVKRGEGSSYVEKKITVTLGSKAEATQTQETEQDQTGQDQPEQNQTQQN